MQEKGLGTPATRAAIIEGLIYEKYIHREGRELVPGAKAFQLMTLLRGLGVEDLTKPELTGNWEYQLAEMEKGQLERETFMAEIARDGRAHRQEGQGVRPRHDPRRLRDADDALPELRRRGQGELPPLRLHRHARARPRRCGFSISKIPGGRAFELRRGRGVPARQADRPARGLPLQGRLAVHRRDQARVRTTRSRTGSSSSISARTPSAKASRASRSTSRRRRAWASARRRRARSSSSAPATSASTRSAPTSPATSRAARSSCSSRSRASR